jgi:hypothetical protein
VLWHHCDIKSSPQGIQVDANDQLRGFSGSEFDAEVAAQRLIIAALQSGALKIPSSATAADAAGRFLATAAITLAKALRENKA